MQKVIGTAIYKIMSNVYEALRGTNQALGWTRFIRHVELDNHISGLCIHVMYAGLGAPPG